MSRTRTWSRMAVATVVGALATRGLVACIYPTDGYREAGRQFIFPPGPTSQDSGDDSDSSGGGDDSLNPPDNNPPPPVDAGSDKG